FQEAAGNARRGQNAGKGAVGIQRGARHQASLGPGIDRVERLDAWFQVEIAAAQLGSELELIRCAANAAPGPNDIKAAVGGSEVTAKVRSADVQRCVGRGRESDVGIDVPVLRGVAKGGVRIKAVI